MPGNPRQQPAVAAPGSAVSPPNKGTAKYTNKDGSKFITVPKTNPSTDSSQPSPSAAPSSTASNAATQPSSTGPTQPVNRKKQKRRAKAAAKAAAEKAQNPQEANGSPGAPTPPFRGPLPAEAEQEDTEDEDEHDDSGRNPHHRHEDVAEAVLESKSKKSKRKKKKNAATDAQASPTINDHPAHGSQPPAHSRSGISKEKIWNTSSQEERERIKEFWLGLGEDERKSLVKVEKDAVLRKMKEQQKHTCSCTVCGRKRTAIEEELEGLYDAYYEELEQFANHPNNQGDRPPMMGRHLGHMSSLHSSRGPPSNYSHQPSHGRIVEHVVDDDEDGGEDYSEDELEDDEYSDEEPPEEDHRPDYATDFFNFGNSLTVQGGILTVADDLLKNDGKKFIEMMEQLAERRMAREEDAKEQYAMARSYGYTNGAAGYGHNHPPPEEEDYDEDEEDFEEEDEEEYDSQEEEDTMTEEQRMEEGRRMFQIFAARMFEQRVLAAYREKVAKERQQRLLEELEEESRQDSQRKAKKAKEAQKRKDKAAKKREALAEEKARKEAEKAAELQARLEDEARRAEEQRLKAEEKRRKKEAQKKAEEEERLRKEAERQRRIHEQKEKQAELERKAREAKEQEKKAREEARQRQEKEAREKKEREALTRKEQAEHGKREKDARSKSEREPPKEKRKQDNRAAQKASASATSIPITLPKRPAQHGVPTAIPALPQQLPTGFVSPKIAVATPALPKAPTPARLRQASQQDVGTSNTTQVASQPMSSSAHNQNPSPHSVTPLHTSPGPIGPMSKSRSVSSQGGTKQSSQTTSPHSAAATKALPIQPSPFNAPTMGMPFPPPGIPQMPPGLAGNRMHHEPMFNPFNPGFRGPGAMPMPPGINGLGPGRGFPMPHHPHPPPGFSQPMDIPFATGAGQGFMSGPPKDASPSQHTRQPSGGPELGTSAPSSQPIGRPTPIGRPASIVHGQRRASGSPASGRAHLDGEDHHLGSSALLDDSDVAVQDMATPLRPNNAAPGPRLGFPAVPFGMDPLFPSSHNPWAPAPAGQPALFSPPPPPGFGPNPGAGSWGSPVPPSAAFGSQVGLGRPNQPRSVAIRQMMCRACKTLAEAEAKSPDAQPEQARDGFIPLESIKGQVDMQNPGEPITEMELINMCDTEGNNSNGGGTFDVRRDPAGKVSIRWVSDVGDLYGQPLLQRPVGAGPGEIRSPKVGASPFVGSSR